MLNIFKLVNICRTNAIQVSTGIFCVFQMIFWTKMQIPFVEIGAPSQRQHTQPRQVSNIIFWSCKKIVVSDER